MEKYFLQDYLPVMSFLYGEMNQNHQNNASVEIGPLICKGTIEKPNYISTSCFSWKFFGMPSGYYLVDKKPHKQSV